MERLQDCTVIYKFENELKFSDEEHLNPSIFHNVSRQAIYEWEAKCDENWRSLQEEDHPHIHLNQHTQEEKDMILRCYPGYNNALG